MTISDYKSLSLDNLKHYADATDYKIDDEFIYCRGIKSHLDHTYVWYKYPIESCIQIVDIYHMAHDYVYSLKVGDTVKTQTFGNLKTGIITKINYSRRVSSKGYKIISTITIKHEYSTDNIKLDEIMYKGCLIRDIIDVNRHFRPNGYHFFDDYSIGNANNIINMVSSEGVSK